MRRLIIECILPFIVALTVIYFFALNKQVNSFLFKGNPAGNSIIPISNYIDNFTDSSANEERFLKSGDSAETIYLLGSSELTNPTSAIPYNFISTRFKTQVIGVGHAGNQCLSVFAQLLANDELLKDAPIVIILSPGWFESKATKGTSSKILLEFLTENFQKKILKDERNAGFHAYLYRRVAELYSEFNSPGLELKLMNFKFRASQSPVHRAVYAPLILCDDILLSLKEKLIPWETSVGTPYKRLPIISESVSIAWDSLYTQSKQEVLKKSTNNTIGFEDAVFTENIHGNRGGLVEPVSEKHNKELNDFMMLMEILRTKKVHASFIISPLNPLYFKNIQEMLPVINLLENEIKSCGFPYLNLMETDTAKYNKAMLHDAMHLSDYGWYRIDHFIIDTYKLSK